MILRKKNFSDRLKTVPIAALLLATALPAIQSSGNVPLNARSTSGLEERIGQIDEELSRLAKLSLRVGVGSLGYYIVPTKNSMEWIEIELNHPVPIDQVVLVPILWRDGEEGFQADGFPAEFRILAGTAEDRNGTVIGDYRSDEGILPRIAPWIAEAGGIAASWVRIEVSGYTKRRLTHGYRLQLSEIMIFSGEENVALRRPVKSSSSIASPHNAWAPKFLTDGHTPYIMDAAKGGSSNAYYCPSVKDPFFTIDLGEVVPISRIHLHPMDQSDTIPMSFSGDFAFPKLLIIEGAIRQDFSDATTLLEIRRKSENELGPLMQWHIPETSCRYIRLSAPSDGRRISIGFTEIELFSNGRNAARGKKIDSNMEPKHLTDVRKLSALTDGLNFYGEILPLRAWMNQLARRHDLEIERPLIDAELNLRYATQKANLNRLGWLAVLLAAGIGFTILIDRILRLQQIAAVRERFAADLHDELGANIHTINLLGELAENKAGKLPDDVAALLTRIRAVSKESGQAVRHLIDMQESKELCSGLKAEMQQAAERIVTELEHELLIEGEEFLHRLNPRTRMDLLLFYKECLVNICRHSEATRLSTQLTATPKHIALTVADNGHGVVNTVKNGVPPSLRRRAHLLHAKIHVDTPSNGGTRIHLKLRTRRRFGFRT